MLEIYLIQLLLNRGIKATYKANAHGVSIKAS